MSDTHIEITIAGETFAISRQEMKDLATQMRAGPAEAFSEKIQTSLAATTMVDFIETQTVNGDDMTPPMEPLEA